MEPSTPRGGFRLGDWLVQPSLNRVACGTTVHHLRPRLMDLLVYLAQHAGQVVSKDQILADVWRQQFVAESVLSRSVADLRRVFDDRAERPRLIETIPKRGYRMIGAVSVAAAPDDPGDGPRGERAAPAGPGVTHRSGRPAGDGRPSIVVLPFVDMAPGRDQEYFCDGLAEELTHRLAHLRGLRVVARTSAFALRGRAMDAREIGRILNVGSLLEGSLQHAGDRVSVVGAVRPSGGRAARAFPLALGFLAGALRLLGRDEEAGRALADLEGIARVRYVGAMAMAVAHRTTPAGQITWFARAFDEHEGVVPLLRTEPNVDHLRGEQGFQALLDRLGLPPLERSGA